MRKVFKARIELFIKQRIGHKSSELEGKFTKYAARMEDLKLFEKTAERWADSPDAKLELLVMEYEVARRLDSIESLLPYFCTSSAMCRMAQDEELHNEDLKKVLRGFREEATARIRELFSRREAVSEYLDRVVGAATQLLLLRKDITHAILAARALNIKTPNAVLEFLTRPEFADMIPHAKGGLKWSRHVEMLGEHEQHAVARELLWILDPKECKAVMEEIYVPGLPYKEEKPDYRIPESLSYSQPKKRKKNGKKNGNGKKREIRYEVEFPEDARKAIRRAGFEPTELGDAIVYSFNLAKGTKAMGKTHFKRVNFEKNIRKTYQDKWGDVVKFLERHDLIMYHTGDKDDVSFNPKPDNEIGQQIAKTIIAYMQTVS